MALTKVNIGKFIELYSEKCGIPNLTIYDVSGINKDKEFFEPSKQVGADTSKYKVVPSGYFACNLMHVGRDVVLPVSLNHTSDNKYVSPAYSVFKVTDTNVILPEFFFMFLKSDEKDRYFWFNTDSSVREGMSWEDFCAVEISLPPVEIQQKYVDIYRSMLENQKCYETALDDLKLVCDAYIEELRRKSPCERIGQYITEVSVKNSDGKILLVQGVESSGKYMDTRAKMAGIDISKYKVVSEKDFAYNPSRINLGSIALRTKGQCIVSPMYTVFKVINNNKLIPEYLSLWLSRKEFHRSTLFYATGSVRDTFDFSLMKDVEIPIPDRKIQRSVADIYKVYMERKQINERLKAQIKDICPILIRGAVEEGLNG